MTYTAKVINSSGKTESDAVSPSSGSLTNGVKETLKITAPKTAGTYKLVVVFSPTIDDKKQDDVTKEVSFKSVAPIKLSLKLTNKSNTDLTDMLFDFYVDGVKVSDEPVKVTVHAGKDATASYDYATAHISNGAHKFKVTASGDSLVAQNITGLDVDHTFYVGKTDYNLVIILMDIFVVILVLIAIYIYRKPVKNFGKPKARR